MGDGFLVEFPSVTGATSCALSIQEYIFALDPENSDPNVLKFRIGVHSGDVIVSGDDIYGDGVNIAARLEGICEPNCVTISEKVHNEIVGKISQKFSSLGTKKLKNLDTVVEIFSWKPESRSSIRKSNVLITDERFDLPSKPSIVVLPFSNRSTDEEQEYFCDGITEDIITELSRFDDIFVISRNTSFTYKRKSIDIRDVAKELAVQYILEGSVRKSGQKVRITSQLIDGFDDTHLWAERFDGSLEDIFELQEQVTKQVVMSLVPEIYQKQILNSGSENRIFDVAYDKAWKARALAEEGGRSADPDHIEEALKLALDAIALNAKCEVAFEAASHCYLVKSLFRIGSDVDQSAENLLSLADSLLRHSPNSVIGYRARGFANWCLGDHKGSIENFRKACELNRNDTGAIYGLAFVLATVGETQESKDVAQVAYRLSPKDPTLGRFFYLSMAMCFFIERDDSNFVAWADKAIQSAPYAPIRRAMMISYATENGDRQLAEKHYNALNEFAPEFIGSVLKGENVVFSQALHQNRLSDGLKLLLEGFGDGAR